MNPRLISFLKRVPDGQVKTALNTTIARTTGRAGSKALKGSAKVLGKGAKAYVGGAARMGGALAEGAGLGTLGQGVAKGVAGLGAVALPFLAAGQTDLGRRAEYNLARGVGSAARGAGRTIEVAGRGVQKLVDPYDPYAGQY